MNIDITLYKTNFMYSIDGVPLSYELKECIEKFLKQNTSKNSEISVDFSGTFIVTSTEQFPFNKLYQLKEAIPNMIKEIQEKKNKKNEDDKKFVENWKGKAILVSDNPKMKKFIKAIENVYDEIEHYKNKIEWDMARMVIGDYDNLCEIFTLIQKSEYKEAYFNWRHMDTAAREHVPDCIVQMLVDKARM